MLTNTYECMAIILRSLRLVANCIRKPIRLIFATFWRICREYIFLHSQGYSPQCESSIIQSHRTSRVGRLGHLDTVLFVLHSRGLKPLLLFYIRVDEKFAGGKFRGRKISRNSIRSGYYFLGKTILRKIKFPKISKIYSTRKIGVIQ